MIVLVVSDFHLGKGKFFKNGQINILEDFFEDDRFAEFTQYYSSGKNYSNNIHLILNGDILNLIQIDIEGCFSHIIDEEATIKALELIYAGHKGFFESLKLFLSAPNKKLTYVIGNHDIGMGFKGSQTRFKELVGSENIDFCYDINIHGIHIEHGHRFEVINTVPPEKTFMMGPNNKEILNLPWGSLFCISVLPQLKKERPFIDKVRPMSSYIKWTLIHDFAFFIKMLVIVMKYFIKTNFDTYNKHLRNFKTNLTILKQVTIYPRYESKAKSILRKRKDIHTVVMGHTHVAEWRRFPEGKYYFNTGTWNMIPSIDAALHANTATLTYVLIDVQTKTNTPREASLNVWQGSWRPFIEEIKLSG